MLILRQQADGRYKYVIAGEGCNRLFNSQYHGAYFGKDLPQRAIDERLAEFESIKKSPRSTYSHICLPNKNREFVYVYRGLFPFIKYGTAVDTLMVVIAPLDERI